MGSASGDRADALGQALQVLIEHDVVESGTFDACDAIDMAEYIRAGKRGVPVEMQLKSPFVTGVLRSQDGVGEAIPKSP